MTPAQVAHIMSLVDEYTTAKFLMLPAADTKRAAVEAALRDAPQAEGWVMVPVEPTPAMLVAMWDHREAMRGQSENRIARAGYATMLAARPSAPTAVEPVQRWPVSQDPLTQLQVAAIISERDAPTAEQSSVVQPRDERAEFEAWYSKYHKDACITYGGIDCTDPKGTAREAWQAAISASKG